MRSQRLLLREASAQPILQERTAAASRSQYLAQPIGTQRSQERSSQRSLVTRNATKNKALGQVRSSGQSKELKKYYFVRIYCPKAAYLTQRLFLFPLPSCATKPPSEKEFAGGRRGEIFFFYFSCSEGKVPILDPRCSLLRRKEKNSDRLIACASQQ